MVDFLGQELHNTAENLQMKNDINPSDKYYNLEDCFIIAMTAGESERHFKF